VYARISMCPTNADWYGRGVWVTSFVCCWYGTTVPPVDVSTEMEVAPRNGRFSTQQCPIVCERVCERGGRLCRQVEIYL